MSVKSEVSFKAEISFKSRQDQLLVESQACVDSDRKRVDDKFGANLSRGGRYRQTHT